MCGKRRTKRKAKSERGRRDTFFKKEESRGREREVRRAQEIHKDEGKRVGYIYVESV